MSALRTRVAVCVVGVVLAVAGEASAGWWFDSWKCIAIPSEYASGSGAEVGDLNGDGHDDVVYGADYAPSIGILLGVGDGTFQEGETPISGSWGVTALALADLDDDLVPDLVALRPYDGDHGLLSVLLGSGDGTFAAPTDYDSPADGFFLDVACGDLTGDDVPDLAVSAEGIDTLGFIAVYPGLGGGAFGAPTRWELADDGICVALADLNGDSILDVVAGVTEYTKAREGTPSDGTAPRAAPHARDATVAVLLGTGGGALAAPVYYESGEWPVDVAIGCLDAGGAPDLAVVCGDGVYVFLGQGDGTFWDATAYSAPTSCVALADFNDDAKLDMLVGGEGGDPAAVSVFLGYGDGTFGPRTDFAGTWLSDVATAEINSDGLPDVVGINERNVVFTLGAGGGSLLAPLTSSVLGPFDLAARDMDRDGHVDLVVAQREYDSVEVLLGSGDGAFSTAGGSATADFPCAVTVDELDGDSVPDVAVAARNADVVSVLFGNGDGTLEARTDYATGDGPRRVVSQQINQDGSFDIVTGNWTGSSISYLPCDQGGNGVYSTHTEFALSNAAKDVAVADMDGDGFRDAVAAVMGSFVAVLINESEWRTFEAPVYYAIPRSASELALADLDGDFDNDVVVAQENDSVCVLLNSGGVLGSPVVYDAGNVQDGNCSVAVGDLDGDSLPDIACASEGTGVVWVLRGLGDGTFAEAEGYGADLIPGAVVIADVDGDGDGDLCTANMWADEVVVLLNRTVNTPVEGAFYAVAQADGSVTVRWSVAGLGSIDGFNVYRATSADGPFVRVNGTLLPAVESGYFEDTTVWPETTFWYELRAVLPDGSEEVVGPGLASVTTGGRLSAALRPARPNPFSQETRLVYDVPGDGGEAELAVYDVAGRLVRRLASGPLARGRHEAVWDGRDSGSAQVAAGVYFVRLEVAGAVKTEKAVVVR